MSKRGRKKLSKSPTKQFILTAGKILFQRHGFNKVYVEEICQKAGASKTSFYRHFEDKTSLALEILQEFLKTELDWSEKLLSQKNILFEEKLNSLLQRKEENKNKLSLKFITELSKVKNGKTDIFQTNWESQVNQINLKFLHEGQRTKTISQKVTPKIFLFFIKKRNELFMDKELTEICPDIDERINIVNKLFYHGLSNSQI